MSITPIRTTKDHANALKEIERLWDKAEPGTAEGDQFEILSTLVDAYEREHFSIPAPDPIEAILFRLEQLGLTSKDLLPVFKTRARVFEIMKRRRRLNLSMIRRLHAEFAIPVEVLVQDYELRSRKRSGAAKTRGPARRKRSVRRTKSPAGRRTRAS